MKIDEIIQDLERKHPNEPEYIQAVTEVLHSVEEVYYQHPEFEKAKIIERMVEPDRILTFRVTWVDDKGEVQTNLGYRVQYNNAIGPYKGGLRFHASVNLSILNSRTQRSSSVLSSLSVSLHSRLHGLTTTVKYRQIPVTVCSSTLQSDLTRAVSVSTLL